MPSSRSIDPSVPRRLTLFARPAQIASGCARNGIRWRRVVYLLTGIVNSGPLLAAASGQRCITLL